MRKNTHGICLLETGLFLLNIMTSSCNPPLFFLPANVTISLFFMAAKNSFACMSHIFIIHLFVDRIVGWLHFLGFGTGTASHVDCRYHFGTLTQEGDSWPTWWFYFQCFEEPPSDFHSGGTSLHPHQQWTQVPLPRPSHQHLLLSIFMQYANIVFITNYCF